MSDFSNTDSSTSLVFLSDDSTPVTSTEVIASETGNEHRAVIQLVRKYHPDFQEFGEVAFQMRHNRQGSPTEAALLNEQQATLLVTYMRNSEVVRDFKKRLVKAFYEFANRVKSDLPQDYLSALKALVVTEEAKQKLEADNATMSAQIEADKPYVELARVITDDTAMPRRDWAKLMQTQNGIQVGERAVNAWLIENKYLFKDKLSGNARPYAKYKDYFSYEKEMINGGLRDVVLITGKGIEALTPKVVRHFGGKCVEDYF